MEKLKEFILKVMGVSGKSWEKTKFFFDVASSVHLFKIFVVALLSKSNKPKPCVKLGVKLGVKIATVLKRFIQI